MNKKHPFDNDKRLSIFYTLAYKEYTSINKINKLMSNTGRYQGDIIQQYPTFFSKKKRDDKRMGELIRSKSKPLFEYISQQVDITNDFESLSNLLNSSDFRKLIHYPYPKNHNQIIDFIAVFSNLMSISKKFNQDNFNPKSFSLDKLLKNLLQFNPNYENLQKKYPITEDWTNNVIKVCEKFFYFNQKTLDSLISLAPHYMIISDVITGMIAGSQTKK
jgi:hypothetical protein